VVLLSRFATHLSELALPGRSKILRELAECLAHAALSGEYDAWTAIPPAPRLVADPAGSEAAVA
jgi:hypothetical protein